MGRVAGGAGVAELILMRILVARDAMLVEPPEDGAGEDLSQPRLVALDAFDLGVATGNLKFCIAIVVEGQTLAAPGRGRVACCTCVVVLPLMRILVARDAILVEPPEEGASEDLLLARLVAIDTLGPAVAVGEGELCVFVVIELQFLAAPTLHPVAGFTFGAQLGLVWIFVTVGTQREFNLRVMKHVMVEDFFYVAFVALQFEVFALQFEGGAVVIKGFFVQRDDRL